MTPRPPLVLCYHAISDDWPHALATSLAAFERQIGSIVRRGYRPASAAEVLAGSEAGVHVTFDDAFRSLVSALPALERLGAPVTVFACSGYASGGRVLDVPELAADAERYAAALSTMDWDALRGLVERGVEVGSHTVSHPHLPQLGDAEVGRELRDSRRQIEDELRRPCRYLAYPFGDEDERIRAAAAAAGYEAAFAVSVAWERRDRFAFPRVGVYRDEGLPAL